LGGEERHPSYGNAGLRPFLFGRADLASCSVHPNLESKPESGEANEGVAPIAPRESEPSYQDRTDNKVTVSFAASGEPDKQIEAGAPVDVFASAGEKEMDQVQTKQLIDQSTLG
jgi:hypothetical protein